MLLKQLNQQALSNGRLLLLALCKALIKFPHEFLTEVPSETMSETLFKALSISTMPSYASTDSWLLRVQRLWTTSLNICWMAGFSVNDKRSTLSAASCRRSSRPDHSVLVISDARWHMSSTGDGRSG